MKRPPRVHLRLGVMVALPALAAAPGPARATPADLFGAGPRSTALAGAGTSLALDAESALVNPAMLAPARKELGFGLRASRFAFDLEEDGAARPFSAESEKSFFLGAVTPLSDGDFESAFGLFAGSPPDFIVRARLPFAEEPDFPLLVGRAGAFDLSAGLGLKHDFWSLGIGVRALAALSGTTGVEERAGEPVQVVDNELEPAVAPVFGLALDPGNDFSLGLSLRTVLRANFDVTLETEGGFGGIPLPPMRVRGVAHYEPFRVDAEVSKRFRKTTLVLGLAYERWSDYPSPLGPTVECPGGVPSCGTRPPPDPDASDVVVPRLAASQEFSIARASAVVSAGYAFAPAALPEQTGASNHLDAARHGFSAGYSLGLPPDGLPLHLDLAFRFDFLAPRTHHKPGGSELSTSGNVQTFVLGARIDL